MSKRCDITETCSCGATLKFSEVLPDDAWSHEHQCVDTQHKFQKAHAKCKIHPAPQKKGSK